jgi:flagellar biogenesis protein FliO
MIIKSLLSMLWVLGMLTGVVVVAIIDVLAPTFETVQSFQDLGFVGLIILLLLISWWLLKIFFKKYEQSQIEKDTLYKEMLAKQQEQIEYLKNKK